MIHSHNGILVGHKKENFTCESMNAPGEHYAKWKEPVPERQVSDDFICKWNLMNKLH